ncbi:MAG: single-stranded DNA-binding protein [Clostridium sp.]
MNSVNLIGRLTKDGKMDKIGEDLFVYNNTIAVKDFMRKDKPTYFFNIKAFGATAKHMNDTASKGDNVGIAGKLIQSEYDDKETNKKVYVVYVEVSGYENTSPIKGEGNSNNTNNANNNNNNNFSNNNNFNNNNNNNSNGNKDFGDFGDFGGNNNQGNQNNQFNNSNNNSNSNFQKTNNDSDPFAGL